MEVSVETTENLERRMTVAIPAENVETEVNKRLKDLRGKVRINGFRPGKVPLSVVKKQYGGQVRQEVVGDLVNSSYGEALTQEDLRPAGSPEIEPVTLPPEAELKYVATFEVYPDIEPNPVSELNITRLTAEIADADVDRVIEKLRAQKTEWQPVERPAQKGDKLTVDFKGSLEDGVEFAGGSATDTDITLGEGRLIDDFETQLEGTSAGDAKTVTVTFPEDYGNKELAGHTANFEVTIKTVAESSLPEVDADFIKAYGVEDGTEDSFRTQVRERLEKERDDAARGKVKSTIMAALLEANPITLPKALITNEVAALRERTMGNIQGGGAETLGQLPDSIFEEDAQRRVALGLLVAELVKRNNIEADADSVRAHIEEAAADYEHPQQVLDWYYGDKSRLTEVEMVVIENKMVDWVLANANISDEMVSFDDLVSKGDANNGA
jgi:trigger factor